MTLSSSQSALDIVDSSSSRQETCELGDVEVTEVKGDFGRRLRSMLPTLAVMAALTGPLSMNAGCSDTAEEDAPSSDVEPWAADDARLDEAIKAETSRMDEEAKKEADEETNKEKDSGGGWHPIKSARRTAGTMIQTMAALLALVAGLGPRIWKGKGPIQSGVSIVASGILFMFYWTAFGLVSIATPVAGVMAGWEPTMWLIKKIGKHGGTPPAAP